MTGEPDDIAAFAAIKALYHAFLTGFILTPVTRAGPRPGGAVPGPWTRSGNRPDNFRGSRWSNGAPAITAQSISSWPVQALP